jgi:hypothetical protein
MSANTPEPASDGRFPWLRRAIRPLRRFAAWFALVNEERETRRGSDEGIETWVRDVERWGREDRERFEAQLVSLSKELLALRREFEAMQRTIDNGIGERADLTLKELWLRLESADAHQATAIQRLADDVAHVVERNAELLSVLDSLRPLESARDIEHG